MKTNQLKLLILVLSSTIALTISAQQNTSTLTYRVETSGNVSEGTYAPLWFTANQYGLSSNETKSRRRHARRPEAPPYDPRSSRLRRLRRPGLHSAQRYAHLRSRAREGLLRPD